MMMLFQLTKPDLIFFICVAVVIVLILVWYFLQPIIKKKQFAEARENLKKREETFRANLKNLNQDFKSKEESED